MSDRPVVMTIAGSDSGGGAGIQADLKTFEAFDCFGTSVITAVTAQNTLGVSGVWEIPVEGVARQIEAILSDLPPKGIKIGMLSNEAIVRTVAELLAPIAESVPIVLDPVMIATSGDRLLQPEAIYAMRTELMPLVTLVTPNELEALALLETETASEFAGHDGLRQSLPETESEIQKLLEELLELGPGAVLVTGGESYPLAVEVDSGLRADASERRVSRSEPVNRERSSGVSEDMVNEGSAGKMVDRYLDRSVSRYWAFVGNRVETTNTHGTGCTLSSAIAARLANGDRLVDAIEVAREYVLRSILQAPGLGSGNGPLLHASKP